MPRNQLHLPTPQLPGMQIVAGEGATGSGALDVFTTRPDTLMGCTYMVIAPEHPMLDALATPDCSKAVSTYATAASRKSDLERTELQKDKTGVFTGSHAVNPANGAQIPIYVADYVLGSYGSGAIMAVPAHDSRDFEFAKTFKLPVVLVSIASMLFSALSTGIRIVPCACDAADFVCVYQCTARPRPDPDAH